jgi:hypothetical protein
MVHAESLGPARGVRLRAAGDNHSVRIALATIAAALATGCGVPSEPAKQAEEIASVAAEGALLAHDAAEGGTTGVFTRVHAQALLEQLETLRPKVREPRLRELQAGVSRRLEKLAATPSDRGSAADIERQLDERAQEAKELAG